MMSFRVWMMNTVLEEFLVKYLVDNEVYGSVINL